MGEAKRGRETKKRRLARFPFCIYCGGTTPADTAEHMPPIGLFRGRERPQGLEFPCCGACNSGTRLADTVAAALSRIYPALAADQDHQDVKKLLRGIRNNIPGLLQEMRIGAGGQKLARKGLPPWIEPDVGFLRVDGPLVSSYMWTFAAKMGLALHFECTGKAVPCTGAIQPIWYSNVQHLRGEIPAELLDAFPERLTLRQGRKHVADQFEYAVGATPDNSVGLYFSTFRQSFAIACFAATDAAALSGLATESLPVVSPPVFRK